ncbi:ABC transporter ATP-binding protein [Clostridium sp. C8-1-8]|uniref:ABC transporter ATP-binding protein n=1 Tax=Clostridium sp. C8-1-8 TaxID=2698831 RepID=UPI00136F6E86|nr:ABC transporter ATP-binding protein [Clostridium sp. C8-1-8]
MNIIKLNNLIKTYGNNTNQVTALKGITLDINRGELISIVGSSGSGKSTLLNVLGLIDDFNNGQYTLDNIDIAKISSNQKSKFRNERFGYVFQNFSLFPQYTVKENLQIPLLYSNILKSKNKIPYKEMSKRIDDYLSKVNMSQFSTKKASSLSGGQQQRVAISRALILDPDIILADEPTGALDSSNAKDILNLLLDINKEGKTVIIVTHDNKIAECCNRIIRIEDGSIVEDSKKY